MLRPCVELDVRMCGERLGAKALSTQYCRFGLSGRGIDERSHGAVNNCIWEHAGLQFVTSQSIRLTASRVPDWKSTETRVTILDTQRRSTAHTRPPQSNVCGL